MILDKIEAGTLTDLQRHSLARAYQFLAAIADQYKDKPRKEKIVIHIVERPLPDKNNT